MSPGKAPKVRSVALTLSLIGAACMSACAGDGVFQDPTAPQMCTDVVPFRAELDCIQQFVFTPTCAVTGCHVNPGAQQGLDLSDGVARMNTVGVLSTEVQTLNRITAGDPNVSYLIMKIQGDPNIISDRMPPPPNAPLPQAVIDVIRTWVENGAQP